MADASATRTKILNACRTLLESDAGAATRMSDVAKAAGVSRQAVYLHFKTRAELLIALTRHIDSVEDVDDRLAASRAATGLDRLDAFIDAWGGYIPVIYPVGRALMAMAPGDDAARLAWEDRMTAMRQGCEAAVRALESVGALKDALTLETGTDMLWTLLSVRNWEALVETCGWDQSRYITDMKALSRAYLCKTDNHG
ncbi:TetR/AcrR family transcriptional regulator [Oceanicaulis sp. MMSF_3324]|uniref:TetR/AcrR family transcriptional regulator n=1 Tax=Oceanicaulis sp. MMSF_3324 TaxID=3046702 RepID=UPI00273F65AD|nr:TetR/AcrR family transcriptional regulator [Oceanicaulis sp. MMSF_3324]